MFPLYLLFSVYIYGDITGNSLVFYDTRAVRTYQQGAASEYRSCFGVGKHTRVTAAHGVTAARGMLIADPDPTPPPEGVNLVPPAPKA